MSITESYKKVHYELRPAKQVERRILIEAFQLLGKSSFDIQTYQYTGMGSVYFVDFILFHRFLGINDMLSVEHNPEIEKRISFNKPFDCVKICIDSIGRVIPTLGDGKDHLLWLDYDDTLQKFQLEDLALAISRLGRRSIILFTVDVEPPKDTETPDAWKEYFEKQAGPFFNHKWTVEDFSEELLVRRILDIIENAIKHGLTGRGYYCKPVFTFVYKDGHQMLTIGGMLCNEAEDEKIKNRNTVFFISKTLL